MSKRILAIYYSQSGQLTDIVENFLQPFEQAEIELEKIQVQPLDDYPFPWSSDHFFDAMPESVLGIPVELKPLNFNHQTYDLIILGYQPWFLSPSIPTTSILKHPDFIQIAKGCPIVTLIGARNMWLNSQEKIKTLLNHIGAKLVGNIALVDHSGNLASAVSIVHWMFTGKKERYLGIFPKPGVSEEDIQEASKWGNIVYKSLQASSFDALQHELVAAKALEVKTNLMFIEGKAGRIFSIWANLIIKKKNRSLYLMIFKYYLFIALFLISPIVLLINTVFFRPFSGRKIKRKKTYYLGVSDEKSDF